MVAVNGGGYSHLREEREGGRESGREREEGWRKRRREGEWEGRREGEWKGRREGWGKNCIV